MTLHIQQQRRSPDDDDAKARIAALKEKLDSAVRSPEKGKAPERVKARSSQDGEEKSGRGKGGSFEGDASSTGRGAEKGSQVPDSSQVPESSKTKTAAKDNKATKSTKVELKESLPLDAGSESTLNLSMLPPY